MIVSFLDPGTEDMFNGLSTKQSRRVCPPGILNVARRKLDYLNAALQLRDLLAPPGNQLEMLKGDRVGQHSIRINDQYRICFTWTAFGAENVEITDYH
jgi:toxin HigB-1